MRLEVLVPIRYKLASESIEDSLPSSRVVAESAFKLACLFREVECLVPHQFSFSSVLANVAEHGTEVTCILEVRPIRVAL